MREVERYFDTRTIPCEVYAAGVRSPYDRIDEAEVVMGPIRR